MGQPDTAVWEVVLFWSEKFKCFSHLFVNDRKYSKPIEFILGLFCR